MARENAFKVEGAIMNKFPNGTYRVALSNGHQLLGFVTGKARSTFAAEPGQKVMLQLSPFDLSQGRILVEKNLEIKK
jgi:translation initiation factor IF-1